MDFLAEHALAIVAVCAVLFVVILLLAVIFSDTSDIERQAESRILNQLQPGAGPIGLFRDSEGRWHKVVNPDADEELRILLLFTRIDFDRDRVIREETEALVAPHTTWT